MIGGGEKKTFERAGVRVKVANHHGIAGGFHEILGGEKMTGFQFMRDVIESFAFTVFVLVGFVLFGTYPVAVTSFVEELSVVTVTLNWPPPSDVFVSPV